MYSQVGDVHASIAEDALLAIDEADGAVSHHDTLHPLAHDVWHVRCSFLR
jgi:hypothetical protein